MNKIRFKPKVKRNNMIFAAVSTFIFVLTSIFYMINLSENKKIFEESENRASVLTKKLQTIENQIKDGQTREEANASLAIGLERADKSFYYFKDKNKFINDLSIMLKNINGINIYKVEYSKSDSLKQMKISIPFAGNYRAVRELLYNIESRFYFLKIDGLNIAMSDEGTLKGIVEIRAYFGEENGGDDNSEK